MWRCMKVKCTMAITIGVLEINKHDLSVSVWMGQRQDVNAMHLLQEFTHVRAGECRKKNILEVDSLKFCFHKPQLMFKKLKQDMVLMELQLGEPLKVWVEERSEEDKELEWNVLGQRGIPGAELMPLAVRSNEVHNSKRPWSRGLGNIPNPIFIHLIISLPDHSDGRFSDHQLPLDGLFEERKRALTFLQLVVVKDIEKSFLFLRRCISFFSFVFVIRELLNKLYFPKFWEGFQFLHYLVKGFVEETKLQKSVIHRQVLYQDRWDLNVKCILKRKLALLLHSNY